MSLFCLLLDFAAAVSMKFTIPILKLAAKANRGTRKFIHDIWQIDYNAESGWHPGCAVWYCGGGGGSLLQRQFDNDVCAAANFGFDTDAATVRFNDSSHNR